MDGVVEIERLEQPRLSTWERQLLDRVRRASDRSVVYEECVAVDPEDSDFSEREFCVVVVLTYADDLGDAKPMTAIAFEYTGRASFDGALLDSKMRAIAYNPNQCDPEFDEWVLIRRRPPELDRLLRAYEGCAMEDVFLAGRLHEIATSYPSDEGVWRAREAGRARDDLPDQAEAE